MGFAAGPIQPREANQRERKWIDCCIDCTFGIRRYIIILPLLIYHPLVCSTESYVRGSSLGQLLLTPGRRDSDCQAAHRKKKGKEKRAGKKENETWGMAYGRQGRLGRLE